MSLTMGDIKPLDYKNEASGKILGPQISVTNATNLRKPNPMWKYMGFGENFRPRLPSRNWMIFLSITGAITTAVIYDKREKKRVQKKWCKLVEHISKEPLDARTMPRKLTIYLEAPPKDGLRVAQDHFKDYVKPILVSSGLDWDIIQGRKEGDIRAEVADRIRSSRLPSDQQADQDEITLFRRKNGIQDFNGLKGDIVVGRNTWKEYVRGVHEGWLGPLTEPSELNSEGSKVNQNTETESNSSNQNETSPVSESTPSEKLPRLAPFISTQSYQTVTVPVGIPLELDPSSPVIFPHILGFLNTPKRLYRFFNRRIIADSVGREIAAAILSSYRPYRTDSEDCLSSTIQTDRDDSPIIPPMKSDHHHSNEEQKTVLQEEEKDWHKSIWKRVDGEPERTWIEPIVLHPLIAGRMRRFELSQEDEERASLIVVPEEEVEGWIKGNLRSALRSCMAYLGLTRNVRDNSRETRYT